MISIIKESNDRDTYDVDNRLKKISHWATSIERIFTNSKEFKQITHDFVNRGDKAEKAVSDKLLEIESNIHKIYKELENMEETMLDE